MHILNAKNENCDKNFCNTQIYIESSQFDFIVSFT
jgi:hypothetical protein